MAFYKGRRVEDKHLVVAVVMVVVTHTGIILVAQYGEVEGRTGGEIDESQQ